MVYDPVNIPAGTCLFTRSNVNFSDPKIRRVASNRMGINLNHQQPPPSPFNMSRESTSLQQSQYQHQNQNQDGPNLTTSQHVLLQKQQEYAGLQALRESSADMVARVEKLGEMSSIMADGGEGESDSPFPFSVQQPDESDTG